MSARPASRERVQARAERLRQIERELIKAAGRKASELTPGDKFRFAHAALMSFQAEVLRARLLAGQLVDSDELLRINAAVEAVLPSEPISVKVGYVDAFVCERCKAIEEKPPAAPPAIAAPPALPALPPPDKPPDEKPDGERRRPPSIHSHPLAPVREVPAWPTWSKPPRGRRSL